jgi:hypothetical protein
MTIISDRRDAILARFNQDRQTFREVAAAIRDPATIPDNGMGIVYAVRILLGKAGYSLHDEFQVLSDRNDPQLMEWLKVVAANLETAESSWTDPEIFPISTLNLHPDLAESASHILNDVRRLCNFLRCQYHDGAKFTGISFESAFELRARPWAVFANFGDNLQYHAAHELEIIRQAISSDENRSKWRSEIIEPLKAYTDWAKQWERIPTERVVVARFSGRFDHELNQRYKDLDLISRALNRFLVAPTAPVLPVVVNVPAVIVASEPPPLAAATLNGPVEFEESAPAKPSEPTAVVVLGQGPGRILRAIDELINLIPATDHFALFVFQQLYKNPTENHTKNGLAKKYTGNEPSGGNRETMARALETLRALGMAKSVQIFTEPRGKDDGMRWTIGESAWAT